MKRDYSVLVFRIVICFLIAVQLSAGVLAYEETGENSVDGFPKVSIQHWVPIVPEIPREYELVFDQSISLSEAVYILNQELLSSIVSVCESIDQLSGITIRYNDENREKYYTNMAQIIAVYCAKNDISDEHLISEMEMNAAQFNDLRRVYWDMVSIMPFVRSVSTITNETDLNGDTEYRVENYLQINVQMRTAWEIPGRYDFKLENILKLNDLTDEESQKYIEEICNGSYQKEENDGNVADLEEHQLDEWGWLRKKVVTIAESVVGKIPYFWGGKSEKLGWDPAWGVPEVITSAGNWQNTVVSLYGLDCSGFVTWVFINAAETTEALSFIGHGTDMQFANCRPISVKEVLPGDLVFTMNEDMVTTHVGIVVGFNEEKEPMICHCSGRPENIVIEPLSVAGCNMVCSPEKYYDQFCYREK